MDQINKITTTEILFQEYIQSSYGRDLRLQVVGQEVVSCMKRISDTDFRCQYFIRRPNGTICTYHRAV